MSDGTLRISMGWCSRNSSCACFCSLPLGDRCKGIDVPADEVAKRHLFVLCDVEGIGMLKCDFMALCPLLCGRAVGEGFRLPMNELFSLSNTYDGRIPERSVRLFSCENVRHVPPRRLQAILVAFMWPPQVLNALKFAEISQKRHA